MSAPTLSAAYELGEPLAEGGTSTVYAALRREGGYQRPVAVKVLRRELAGTEAALRFRAERQILARLEHPHIARLYDAGTTPDGRPFLVLERVEGQPIDAWCDAQRLGVEERLAQFLKVCGAVDHAHGHVLVHCDRNPTNILVVRTGQSNLIDFGLARQLYAGPGDATPAPRLSTGSWTPAYASPEQLPGRAITTATDVYSLGVVLYGLLTGL